MPDIDYFQEQKIGLSVCIPTYNFGAYIGATLDSILCQILPDMEIIIVDGGSEDNTEEVVRAYQKISSQIIYHKLPVKGGIDNDMALSVSLAKGDYCWLFSSDDIMKPDAIQRIYQQLKEKHDIYICGFTIHSLDFTQMIIRHPIFDSDRDIIFNMQNPVDRKAFFEQAITTTAFFSFMSSLVFKKILWNSAENVDEFYGSCWAHAARFFSILSKLKVKYLHDIYLEKRSGNDSFMDKGIIHRVGISVYGWNHIANKYLGRGTKESFHVRRVLRCEWFFDEIKTINASKLAKDKAAMKKLIKALYSDGTYECHLNKAQLLYPSYGSILLSVTHYYHRVKRRLIKLFDRIKFLMFYSRKSS